jgi:hypothetical protein
MKNKIPRQGRGIISFGGERGIRTPGTFQYNGFQDRRIRPLCHLSGRESKDFFNIYNNNSTKNEINIF